MIAIAVEFRSDRCGAEARRRHADRFAVGSKRTRPTGKPKDDILFSSRTPAAVVARAFKPPSPQLFSFNSPQGMCPACDGLGQAVHVCAGVAGPRRKEIRSQRCDRAACRNGATSGVIDGMFIGTLPMRWTRCLELKSGTMLEGRWSELPEQARMSGCGEPTIRCNSPGEADAEHASTPATFDGFIPELLDRYRTTRNKMQLRQYEKFMSTMDCVDCDGRRLNPQASAVTISFGSQLRFSKNTPRTLPELCELSIEQLSEFFSDIRLSHNDATIAAEALKEIRTRLGSCSASGSTT